MRLWRASGASLHLSRPSTQAGNTMSYYCITIDGALPGGQKEILTFYGQERINNPLLNRYRKT